MVLGHRRLLALLWSFGGNSLVYPALYNVLPGLRFFRGQERAAYLVVNSLAILAGMGAAWLMQWDTMRDHVAGMRLRLALNRAFTVALALGALVFVTWIGNPAGYGTAVGALALAVIVSGALYLIISTALARGQAARAVADRGAAGLRVVHGQHGRRRCLRSHAARSAGVDERAAADRSRARGQRYTLPRRWRARLTDNYGSLYDVMDIHGISPLWLAGPYNIDRGRRARPALVGAVRRALRLQRLAGTSGSCADRRSRGRIATAQSTCTS